MWYIAQARNVRALFCLLIGHYIPVLSGFTYPPITIVARLLTECMQISKRQLQMAQRFPRCWPPVNGSLCPDGDGRVGISTDIDTAFRFE
jgi:hypothetical protein